MYEQEKAEMTIKAPYRAMTALGLAALVMLFSSPKLHAATAPAGTEEGNSGSVGFALDGEPVTGGSNPGDAVELAPGGPYIDEFGEETKHYRIPRELENSTLHVGVSTFNNDGETDSVNVELSTWGSDYCSDETISSNSRETRDQLRSAYLGAAADPEAEPGEDPCGQDDELVLTVGYASNAEGQSLGQPYEIVIYEEPQPENAAQMLEEPDYSGLEWTDMGRDISGATEISAGSSFDEAPALEPGTTYDVTIRPGEFQIFRVPLEWGEYLQAEAFFPEPGDTLSEELSGFGSFSIAVLNPMRGLVYGDSGSISRNSSSVYQSATDPVSWNNRTTWGHEASSVAGDYYLVMAADPLDSGNAFPINYRLTIDTFTTEIEGQPEYPSGLEETRPEFSGGSNEENDEEAGGTASGEEATSVERIRSLGDNSGIVASFAAFGLLLMAAGSLVLVRVARKTD